MDEDIQLLFREVADLAPAQRDRYFVLHQVSTEAREEVESLLHFDRVHGEALGVRVEAAASQFLDLDAAARPGDRCGPYQLMRIIGRGGMGAVFLARRTDGEVEQRVAIKLVRDATNEQVLRDRFLRERQILASLNHPGIAHLLDAGHTHGGQPYLAMEYVEGVPIDVYSRDLSLRDKLRLFLLVCDAVSYAHRSLIIHRDLKPSNILVQSDGQPKLLDFGIARLLDEADHSQTRERILSLDFASPEQVRGVAHTTATDVYSLGATFYTLLAGKSPHEAAAEGDRPVEERICFVEPPPASRLNPALPHDVDFVLSKALRKEPEERYATVDTFAADLRAVLESRPVQARAGNAFYRTRKFMRRYWMPVSAAALVIASLSAGLYVANRERAIAQKRFMEVRQLANKLFDIDSRARELPGSTSTRQFIVDTSLEYLGRLAADVQNDPGLGLEVGNAYMRVARVQGVPIGPNLGQLDKAEANLRIAGSLVDSVLKSQPRNRMAMLRAAQIAHDRMLVANYKHQEEEALRFADASAAWLDKFHAQKSDGAEDSAILNTYLNVSNRYVSEHQFARALNLTSRAIELSKIYDFPAYHGTLLWAKARILQRQGDLDGALAAIRESVALLETGGSKSGHGQRNNLGIALVYEGRILDDENGVSQQRPEEAVVALQRAFDVIDALVHQDPNNHNDRSSLANAAVPLGASLSSDPLRALAMYDHVLQHLSDEKGDAHLQAYTVELLSGSSYALRRLNRTAEARKRVDSAIDLLRQLKRYPAREIEPGSETALALRALADQEAAEGHLVRALQDYQDLLDGVTASKPEPDADLEDAARMSNIYSRTAALQRRAKQFEAAAALERRQTELWSGWQRKLPNNPFVMRQLAAIPAAHTP